jgi:hypothetical protein
MPYRTQALKKLIRNTLGSTYVNIEVLGYEIHEELHGSTQTELHVGVRLSCLEESYHCTCRGSGFVDALFHGLLSFIKDLNIATFPPSFSPTIAHFNVGSIGSETAGKAQSVLAIYSRASRPEPYTFTAEEFSINAASMSVVVQAVEFFINAHLSYTAVSNALQDSKRRGRVDLVEHQTRQLIELVQVADYSSIPRKTS